MRIVWLFLLVISAFSACQKVDDTERPVASINSPIDGAIVQTQDGLLLQASLVDNTGLLQFKIVVSGVDSSNDISADSTYATTFIDALPKETSHFLEHLVELPDTTFNGFYYAVLSCLDVEGNESIKDTVRFQVINSIDSEPAQFNVSGPVELDTMSLGQGFSIQGTTTDSRSLVFSDMYVGKIGATSSSDTILYFKFTEPVDNTIDYNSIGWFVQVDSSWNQGAYHMYVTGWDNYSGASYEVPFYVFY